MGACCILFLLVGLHAVKLTIAQEEVQVKKNCTSVSRTAYQITFGNTNTVTSSDDSKILVVRNESNVITEKIINGKKVFSARSALDVLIRDPIDKPEEYKHVTAWGSYKYHSRRPFSEMKNICAKEGAIVAYPITENEVNVFADILQPPENILAIGLKRTEFCINNFDGDRVSIEDRVWEEDEDAWNDSGECVSLNVTTRKLYNVSCDGMMPFFCRKVDEPGEYKTVYGFGSYKYHRGRPFEERKTVCESEGAVVAYPFNLDEMDVFAEKLNSPESILAVGLKRDNIRKVTYNSVGHVVWFEEELWNKNTWNDSGEYVSLNLTSRRLYNISDDGIMPFFCKKDDGFEKGYGYYTRTYSDQKIIEMMEGACETYGMTVAAPSSSEEAKLIAQHAMNGDEHLSIGIQRVNTSHHNETKFVHVGHNDTYVDIKKELWAKGEPTSSGNCVVIDKQTYKLHMANCEHKLGFVCKKDLDACNYAIHSRIRYHFQPWYMSADEANEKCKALNETVAFPKGEKYTELAEKIANLIPDDEPFITTGIEYVHESQNFKIMGTNDTVSLNGQWPTGKPSKNQKQCVKFSKEAKKFHFYDCKDRLPFVCAKRI